MLHPFAISDADVLVDNATKFQLVSDSLRLTLKGHAFVAGIFKNFEEDSTAAIFLFFLQVREDKRKYRLVARQIYLARL